MNPFSRYICTLMWKLRPFKRGWEASIRLKFTCNPATEFQKKSLFVCMFVLAVTICTVSFQPLFFFPALPLNRLVVGASCILWKPIYEPAWQILLLFPIQDTNKWMDEIWSAAFRFLSLKCLVLMSRYRISIWAWSEAPPGHVQRCSDVQRGHTSLASGALLDASWRHFLVTSWPTNTFNAFLLNCSGK